MTVRSSNHRRRLTVVTAAAALTVSGAVALAVAVTATAPAYASATPNDLISPSPSPSLNLLTATPLPTASTVALPTLSPTASASPTASPTASPSPTVSPSPSPTPTSSAQTQPATQPAAAPASTSSGGDSASAVLDTPEVATVVRATSGRAAKLPVSLPVPALPGAAAARPGVSAATLTVPGAPGMLRIQAPAPAVMSLPSGQLAPAFGLAPLLAPNGAQPGAATLAGGAHPNAAVRLSAERGQHTPAGAPVVMFGLCAIVALVASWAGRTRRRAVARRVR